MDGSGVSEGVLMSICNRRKTQNRARVGMGFPFILMFLSSSLIADPLSDREAQIRAAVQPDLAFKIEEPRPGGPVLKAADFGVRPAALGKENVARLREALAKCREAKASRLVFAPGVYRMQADRVHPTKNPQYAGMLSAIELENLADFVFDGNGAEFIFEQPDWVGADEKKKGGYFFIADCRRVAVRNLTVDWDWASLPLGFFATITAVDRESLSLEYRMDAPFADAFGGPFRVYGMRAWDAARGTRSPEGFSFAIGSVATQARVGKDQLRIGFKTAKAMEKALPGEVGLFKTEAKWYAIGFIIDSCVDLTLDRVTLYGCSANGVWTRKNRNLQIKDCKITPRPGTRPVHTAHSALEIHNHFGGFRLEGNLIEWQNDDALHYSDFFVPAGWTRVDDFTLNANNLMYFQNGDTFRVGDRLNFRSEGFLPTGVSRALADVKWTMQPGTAKNFATLRFTEAIPADLPTSTYLFNEDSFGIGRYVIRSNLIRNGVCMGLAVHMPNGLIEGNVISNVCYPGLLVATTVRWGRWTMGHAPSNVIIRGNLLDQVNRALQPPADSFVAMGVEPQGKEYEITGAPVVRNIIYESNIIRGSGWQAVVFGACRDVLVKDNRFIDANRLPSKPGYGGAMMVKNAEGMLIVGNRAENPSGPGQDQGLVIEGKSTKDILVGKNPGMESRTAP